MMGTGATRPSGYQVNRAFVAANNTVPCMSLQIASPSEQPSA